MAINPSQLGAAPIESVTDFAIQITYTKPDTSLILSPAAVPNVLIGYFNTATNRVELYVTSPSGLQYVKVR